MILSFFRLFFRAMYKSFIFLSLSLRNFEIMGYALLLLAGHFICPSVIICKGSSCIMQFVCANILSAFSENVMHALIPSSFVPYVLPHKSPTLKSAELFSHLNLHLS